MVAVRADAAQEEEWLRQLSLIYGGLIAIGVYMVQPFLTASSLDLSAKVCVVAFAVAIPLLAALVVLNRQEAFRRGATKSVVAEIARVVAQTCAFVGVVAAFWQILWIAGAGVLASGLAAVAVHSASYWRLEQDQEPTPQEGEEPADAEP
jgi:small-conductance mechanosensitive channel